MVLTDRVVELLRVLRGREVEKFRVKQVWLKKAQGGYR
jgi:hypothetical protein